MADLNRVYLLGNLTRDPEVRYAPSGDAVGDLQLAVNRRFRGRDGQDREETCFVGIVVWGRQAETCAQYLRKGAPVLVEGRLQYDQWEKDGQKHSRLRVRADRVQFLSGPRSAQFADGGPGGSESSYGQDSGGYDSGSRDESPGPPDPGPTSAAQMGDDDNLPF